jgi:hypothetical protein
VFDRPDHDIRREIVDEVIMRAFSMDPSRFIHVDDRDLGRAAGVLIDRAPAVRRRI